MSEMHISKIVCPECKQIVASTGEDTAEADHKVVLTLQHHYGMFHNVPMPTEDLTITRSVTNAPEGTAELDWCL